MSKKINQEDVIFLAGGSGMVGSSIKRNLLKNGYGIGKNSRKILSPSRKELDLLDFKSVKDWFEVNNPTVVIIAAAKVGGIYANQNYPADFIFENLKIQSNIIECAWSKGIKRLLFLGSSCIYPKYATQPIKEENLLEGGLESTNEPYAIAKIAGMKLCEALRIQYGFDAISLMPTNLYGPNDNYHPENSHVMAALIRKFMIAKLKNLPQVTCWGSGNVLREFMHVDDLAEAIIYCLEYWDPSDLNAPKDCNGKKLNFLNVGTGVDISIRRLAEKISSIVNFKGEIIWDHTKPDGTPKKLLNVKRINDLGWKAKIDLDSGIRKTIENINF